MKFSGETDEMIICCGEALIDMLPRQLENGEGVFLPVSGGAVFNTAITLGRLGLPTGFVSGISNDMFGEQLVASLKASRVSTSLCVRSNRPSTLAFVRLKRGHAQYTFMDENSAGRMLDTEALPKLPDDVAAMHFGAISLIAEPCGTAFEALMQRYQNNAVISLDPNIRPGFIADPQSHRARINRMVAMSDIVKVSDEDLDWMTPGISHQRAIDAMLDQVGVSIVLLTKGAGGVSAYTRNGELDLAADTVEVVDTIGAGDSFNGGFLAGLHAANLLTKSAIKMVEPEALRTAAELAIRVAGITVSRAGANPPWAREVGIDA